MDQALLSQKWRQYFAEDGQIIFDALKGDKRPQKARGKTGDAARVAAILTWGEVIARVDPIWFGSAAVRFRAVRSGVTEVTPI
jgi:hypothetical protein